MLVFSTPLVNQRPSNLLTGSPPPPLPVRKSTGLCIYTVCNGGGRIGLCGEHLQKLYQILNLQNCFYAPEAHIMQLTVSALFLINPGMKGRGGGVSLNRPIVRGGEGTRGWLILLNPPHGRLSN
jgi:hypothetical protein